MVNPLSMNSHIRILYLEVSFSEFSKTELTKFSKYYKILQSITKYYKILQNITKYYKILQNITKYYKILQNITKYYKILQNVTKYYKMKLTHIQMQNPDRIINSMLIKKIGQVFRTFSIIPRICSARVSLIMKYITPG